MNRRTDFNHKHSQYTPFWFTKINLKCKMCFLLLQGETTEKTNTPSDDQQQQQQYIDTQKKIMPWNLIPSDDLMLQSELSRKKDLGSSDLILCAVLVDKIPNLGGLARTSEIFGVKRLVIGSNRYLSDPSFKSLSVTSEKWLDIQQVILIKLASYLDEMRNEGYTIVGVEQTAKSKMIGQFEFLRKSVLVLGNEKTGIDILQTSRANCMFYTFLV